MGKVHYAKQEVFTDEFGHTVRVFNPAGSYEHVKAVNSPEEAEKIKKIFSGTVNVTIQQRGCAPQQQPITFQFPAEVTTIQEAFEAFEKCSLEVVEDLKAKSNIVPAHTMPKLVDAQGRAVG